MRSLEGGVPVYRPPLEEFQGFARFVRMLEHDPDFVRVGVAKVIPPEGWTVFDYERALSRIKRVKPITQTPHIRDRGLAQLVIAGAKPRSVEEFERMARGREPQFDAEHADVSVVKRRFWAALGTSAVPPIYGSDNVGTLFLPEQGDASGWAVSRLDTEIQLLGDIPGVTTSMLYFGTWRSMFAWHTEDHDLPAINYLHFGAPKLWMVIPPSHSGRFNTLADGLFSDMRRETRCRNFVRHKTTVIAPSWLQRQGIPVSTVVQRPGEFMITCSAAYHGGFNFGYNCAEAVNFAFRTWLPFGHRAIRTLCNCRPDTVRIDMDGLGAAIDSFDADHPGRLGRMLERLGLRGMAALETEKGAQGSEGGSSDGSGGGDGSGADASPDKRVRTDEGRGGDDDGSHAESPSSGMAAPAGSRADHAELSPDWADPTRVSPEVWEAIACTPSRLGPPSEFDGYVAYLPTM